MKVNFLSFTIIPFLLIACGGDHQTGRPRLLLDSPSQEQSKIKTSNELTSSLPDPTHFVEFKRIGKTLFISGKEFRLQENETKLKDFLSGNEIERLVFHLDQLSIEGPLRLYEKQIEIRVRKLEFKNKGVIDVSGLEAKGPGEKGGDAGDILLEAHEIIDDSTFHTKRFVLDGGKGGNARKGQNGKNGANVPALENNIVYEEISKQVCTMSDFAPPSHKSSRRVECRWITEKKLGHKSCPKNGVDAISAGRPGLGGSPGHFKSMTTLDLKVASLISEEWGKAGNVDQSYKGGAAGLPVKAVFSYKKKYANGKVERKLRACPQTKKGKDAPSLKAYSQNEIQNEKELFFHSTLERMKVVMEYAEVLWSKGYREMALKELSWIESGIEKEKIEAGRNSTLLALLETRLKLLKLRLHRPGLTYDLDVLYLEDKFKVYFAQNLKDSDAADLINNYFEYSYDLSLGMSQLLSPSLKREMRDFSVAVEGEEGAWFREFMFSRSSLHQMQHDDLAQMMEVSKGEQDLAKIGFYQMQNDIEYFLFLLSDSGVETALEWFQHKLYLDMLRSVQIKMVTSKSSRNTLIQFDRRLIEVVHALKSGQEISDLTLESLVKLLYQL